MQGKKLSMQPCMMYQGNAAKAIDLYKIAFTQFEVTHITKRQDGSILYAQCFLNEQSMICMDYPVAQRLIQNPAHALFVQCKDELELTHTFAVLAKGGHVRVPLKPTAISALFGWVEDRFGVSWQLHVPLSRKK